MAIFQKMLYFIKNIAIINLRTSFGNCTQKVGEPLSKERIAKNVFQNVGAIAKTSDFKNVGLTNYDIAKLCKNGVIERIRNGFYQLPNNYNISEEQLISNLLPYGTVCVESALFHYGYSDFAPREWSIAVPRTYRNQISNIQEVPIKAYYVQKNIIELGKTIGDFNGITLPVYDRERTICDCFKYRTKLDSETFNKALNAYVSDDKKNLLNLSKYAKEMHVYTKMMSVMEVLLNG